MNKQLKYFLRDFVRFVLTPKGYTYLRFVITHKYIPDFENPKTFSEKIISRKFDSESVNLSKYVDKYTVREYVKSTIGEEYLIPLVKTFEHLNEDLLLELPKPYVLKTSNGGGGENVLLVKEDDKINLKSIASKFNDFLKVKIGNKIDEHFYDIEKPIILVEDLIKHKDGSLPNDYKIHIFRNDGDRKIIIQVDRDRFKDHKRSLFNENLERLSFDIQPKYDSVEVDFVFPDNFHTLIDLACKLAVPFNYVRVDMYNVDGKVYFGELTFCHGSGWEPLSTYDADVMLGKYWK